MAELFDILNNINTSSNNLLRGTENDALAQKDYVPYMVSRFLSYHIDTLFQANDLNVRGLNSHNITKRQHYEALLHSVPKKKRFAKWEKPELDKRVELIRKAAESVNNLGCGEHGVPISTRKAIELAAVLTDQQLAEIESSLDQGGCQNTSKSHVAGRKSKQPRTTPTKAGRKLR